MLRNEGQKWDRALFLLYKTGRAMVTTAEDLRRHLREGLAVSSTHQL